MGAATRRRQYGQGSLRERSAGHYELRAYSRSGRQVTTTYPGRGEPPVGKREAQRALARFVAEVEAGTFVPARQRRAPAATLEEAPPRPTGPDHTLAALLDAWLAQCEARGKAPTTMRGYRLRAGRYKASTLGTKPVDTIGGEDIDKLHATWVREGMSHAGVLHHFRVLRAALRQGVKWHWLPTTPTADATVTTPPQRHPEVPTPEQLRAIVERSPDPDFRGLILLAALTGARRGELCALRWSDWEGSTLTFRGSIYEFWESGQRKTGLKGLKHGIEKRVALDASAVAVLAERRERAERQAAAAGITLPDDGFVWSPAVDGSLWRGPDGVTSAFDHITRSLAGETGDQRWHKFTFHSLRHLSATTQVAAGIDPITVAHRLGHSDASMVLRIYGHALPQRDQAAAEVLGAALALPAATEA